MGDTVCSFLFAACFWHRLSLVLVQYLNSPQEMSSDVLLRLLLSGRDRFKWTLYFAYLGEVAGALWAWSFLRVSS